LKKQSADVVPSLAGGQGSRIDVYLYGKDYKIKEMNLEKAVFEFRNEIFETNLIFPIQIENLVGALNYLSLIDDLENYREKIKNIELPEGFLKLKINNNLYIFDDSYNANPKGVFEGLKFFKELDFDYKVIIFNGLLELGKETKKIYQDLAKEFSAFDKIILTSSDFIEIFKEVLKDKVLLVKNTKELEIFLQSLKFEKIGIWIFNRFPERINFFNQ
jgi:UDP-N-acetylmuramyl pentapeptide synthase